MALELAPRESMAITLADSFLNDLDELEADDDEEDNLNNTATTNVSSTFEGSAMSSKQGNDQQHHPSRTTTTRSASAADEIAADLDDLDEMDDDDDEEEEEEENLEAVLSGMREDVAEKNEDSTSSGEFLRRPATSSSSKKGDSKDTALPPGVAKLRRSDRYKTHMALVARYAAVPETSRGNLRAEAGNEEYAVLVASNEVLARAEAEIVSVHRYVADAYAKKFPELETLVPQPLDYCRVVEVMRNEMDMTRVDLSEILPPAVAMVVSVTGSTTSGVPLSDLEIDECLSGCDECQQLERDKGSILTYLESRMSVLAPNLTVLVGSSLAAMLLGMAGGLEALAAVPAANLVVMGQTKHKDLSGFGNAVATPHTGVLVFSDLVQAAPAPLRRKCLKLVAAKASLAVRVDAFGDNGNATNEGSSSSSSGAPANATPTTTPTEEKITKGSAGYAYREEIKAKIEKLCEPPKARRVKALPAPDILAGKKKRGGKRVRKAKDKLRLSEMRSLANKRAFAHDFGAEYGDDSMGVDFGLLGKEGGALRGPATKDSKSSKTSSNATQQQAQHKKRKMIQLSSGATNGLSSSLVFTPVQGIELADPTAAQAKVDAANAKWFNPSSGFQSALPQSSTAGPAGKQDGLTV